jgi:hypothetical protein
MDMTDLKNLICAIDVSGIVIVPVSARFVPLFVMLCYGFLYMDFYGSTSKYVQRTQESGRSPQTAEITTDIKACTFQQSTED